jgi:BirA family biotin operon repressor/biotin-[acetyl-CoA-carboxylase] ligase
VRETVLEALRQREHVSGEEIAKRLHVSRTAVWKCISQLRRMGYDIHSSPGLGYTLAECPDLLLPEEIGVGLSTRLLGRRIEYFEEVSSTQDIARQLAVEGAQEGTVVVAESQAGGRGRLGRGWVSPSRAGIYVSIILRPDLKPVEVCQIPLIAGVATSEAIVKVTGLEPRIKWPNDVLVAGKKVAGILTEMGAEVDRLHYIVLGIGINVNTTTSMLPRELRSIATSVAEECGEKLSRVKLVQTLFEELEDIYGEFKRSGFKASRDRWKSFDSTIGSWVKVSMGEKEIEGEALDIDTEGSLIVRTGDGHTERIIAGDVALGIHYGQ